MHRIEYFLNILEIGQYNIKKATKNRDGALQIIVSCTSFKAKKGQQTILSPKETVISKSETFSHLSSLIKL